MLQSGASGRNLLPVHIQQHRVSVVLCRPHPIENGSPRPVSERRVADDRSLLRSVLIRAAGQAVMMVLLLAAAVTTTLSGAGGVTCRGC
jgi:hypothetical protein